MDYAIVPRQTLIDEAVAAFEAGKGIDSCSYMPGSDHARAWRAGFRMAPGVVGFRQTRTFMRERGWV